MKEQNTIEKLLSFFLLLVFALSSTPKIYFHNVVADHEDIVTVCKHADKAKACIHQQTFHCAVDDLVVSTPYFFGVALFSSSFKELFNHYNSLYSFLYAKPYFLNKESRGPPSIYAC